MNETDYHRGFQAANDAMLRQLLREAKPGNPETWRLERNEAIATLRDVCEEYGDNDWPDDLNMSDIIEKHLRRHLDSSNPTPRAETSR